MTAFPLIIFSKSKSILRGFVKVLVNHKIFLYLLLIGLVIISWFTYISNPDNSLTSNFFTGFVELLITVVIVDALINLSEEKQKKEKYATLNKSTAAGLKIQTMMSVHAFAKFINFKSSKDAQAVTYLELTNAELKFYVESLLESKEMADLIALYEKNPKKAIKSIRELDAILKLHVESHEKTLEKVQPYPDPEIIEKIYEFKVNIHAHLQVVQDIYNAMHSAEIKKKDKDGIAQFEKLIWVPLIRGEIHQNKGISNIISEYLSYCLYVHEKSENNDLELAI